jgi:hypothetical protein
VASLVQNVGRIVADAKARNILVKQQAFENANKACKTALQPYRQRVILQEMIRICVDVGPSHIQGIALAAALKVFCPGGKKKEHIFPVEKRNILLGSVRISPNHSKVFQGLSLGHRLAPMCPGLDPSPHTHVLGVEVKTLGK